MEFYPTYDCHGKTYYEVRDKLSNWLLINQFRTPLHIITGMSQGMREVVIEVLNRYEFKYGVPDYNHGIIIVL